MAKRAPVSTRTSQGAGDRYVIGLAGAFAILWLLLAIGPRYRADWAIEAAVAQLTHPELGAAFVGSQGDLWDAQHDMLAATCGTVIALLLIATWLRWADGAPIGTAAAERG